MIKRRCIKCYCEIEHGLHCVVCGDKLKLTQKDIENEMKKMIPKNYNIEFKDGSFLKLTKQKKFLMNDAYLFCDCKSNKKIKIPYNKVDIVVEY